MHDMVTAVEKELAIFIKNSDGKFEASVAEDLVLEGHLTNLLQSYQHKLHGAISKDTVDNVEKEEAELMKQAEIVKGKLQEATKIANVVKRANFIQQSVATFFAWINAHEEVAAHFAHIKSTNG